MISNNNGYYNYRYLVGGMPWYAYSSEKYESQLGWWHSQYDGKNKIHVPNHQPDNISHWLSLLTIINYY